MQMHDFEPVAAKASKRYWFDVTIHRSGSWFGSWKEDHVVETKVAKRALLAGSLHVSIRVSDRTYNW